MTPLAEALSLLDRPDDAERGPILLGEQLAAKLGARFPMEPGKGYSFFVKPATVPKHGVLFPDIHAGATPFGDLARISGTMEFSGYELTVDRRRIDNVFRLAKDYIELERPRYEEPWAGLRPMTVDGLPILEQLWSGSTPPYGLRRE